MSPNILERVRGLINLSASANENEARSAAYEACRLIREHKLDVILGSSAYGKPPEGGGGETPMSDLRRDVNGFLDGLEILMGKRGGGR